MAPQMITLSSDKHVGVCPSDKEDVACRDGNMANFVNSLPRPLGRVEADMTWMVKLETIGFDPVFSNIPKFECVHDFIVWECTDFVETMGYNVKEDVFPTDLMIESRFDVRKFRIRTDRRYGSLNELIDELNKMFRNGFNSRHGAEVAFSEGADGINIACRGSGVLLISGEVHDWMELGRIEDGGSVSYGPNHTLDDGGYMVYDFSSSSSASLDGDEIDSWNKTVIHGHEKRYLLDLCSQPSQIAVDIFFETNGESPWSNKRLAVLPYNSRLRTDSPGEIYRRAGSDNVAAAAAAAAAGYFCFTPPTSEFVRLDNIVNDEDLYDDSKFRIVLRDERGRTLRLAGNPILRPTYVTLSFKQVPTDDLSYHLVTRINHHEYRFANWNKNGVDHVFHFLFDEPIRNARRKCEVAMGEVYLPVCVRDVEPDDPATAVWITTSPLYGGSETRKLGSLDGAAFGSNEDLVGRLKFIFEKHLSKVAILGESISDSGECRMLVSMMNGVEVIFGYKLAVALGFNIEDCVANTASPIRPEGGVSNLVLSGAALADRTVDVRRLIPGLLAVHCDIVEPVVIGDRLDDVIGIIPVDNLSGPARRCLVYHQPNRLVFHNICYDTVDRYNISLRNMSGRRVYFQENDGGSFNLGQYFNFTLHFREKIRSNIFQ